MQSQIKKHPQFNPLVEGGCWAPPTLDAMANCSSVDLGIGGDVDIRVEDDMNNFVSYSLKGVNSDRCTFSYGIKCNGATFGINPTELVYSDKPLSVVNVIRNLIATVEGTVGGLPGSNFEEKLQALEKTANSQFIIEVILPIFGMKLFGDFGQELFAVDNNLIFTSNDRPSAARYLLMKIFCGDKLSEPGGGGYFPNTPSQILSI